ncbi:putative toxin-antitoxin system antitoxin component [Tetragenococcus halophilus subsp. halophilus]|uniref:Type II toxin-antitoxin system RelB/DinJ family antitoxin n=1 Tax=Tetragenococcus halophilus TaxID=51669 RepID=A0AB35HMW6_TETHA|nr:type II toxin-antitoxin system RelB/DinJ family antitoxin [Tetragenococcus halophilus]AOF48360.1 toxin-antitoxin system antitoxin subunit [Tetragenococcus halophilus]MCF1685148.1 type II toxin-antitoxin system RelB/DinJ family antitoxin [Tetragenococcus halophilus]MCO8284426.1 type II toxin-antitoxin system RelB/DinJ family antitoxin [Tetragenococcus halophilus]MCO8287638.1 type II toxin-antitoxin system RelB/DinJ family antitoxin [Tetragenococcus halophilus]MCO8289312.1 type II toxin-antit
MTNQVHFRMNEEDKEKFRKVMQSIGLEPNEAYRIFVKRSIEVGGIPFEVSVPNSQLEEVTKSQDYIEFENGKEGLDWLNEE